MKKKSEDKKEEERVTKKKESLIRTLLQLNVNFFFKFSEYCKTTKIENKQNF